MEALQKTPMFWKEKSCLGENREAHENRQVSWKPETKKLKPNVQQKMVEGYPLKHQVRRWLASELGATTDLISDDC